MGDSKQNWGIVGGGMLGMLLAYRLAQRGCPVTLYEGAADLGGLAGFQRLGDLVWDRYYHVILLSDTSVRSLLCELGLEGDLNWVETRTGFYTEGNLYSMSSVLDFFRFPPLNFADKLRLAGTIYYASKISDWRRMEGIPVADWLRRWSGKTTFDKIWGPLLRAKMGEDYRHVSAAFIWATISRMYAARRTGLKKELFGYVNGGYSRIIQHFGEVLRKTGVRIETGFTCQRVTPDTDGKLAVAFKNGVMKRCNQVIITTPAPVAVQLCPSLSEKEKSAMDSIKYMGIVCASVLLTKPLAGYYVTNLTESWVPFTAVIEMSALVDRCRLNGHSLVYLPKYVSSEDVFFSESDEVIEEVFLEALFRIYSHISRSDVLSFHVSREHHVFAPSTLNYSKKVPPTKTSVPGLYIVNSSQIVNGTLNVNQTIQLAESALAEIVP
jgi:protoporphyrinogen oxidase